MYLFNNRFLILIFLVNVSCKQSLDLSKYNVISTIPHTSIKIDSSVSVSLSVIETAFVNTKESLTYKGGKFFKKIRLTYSAIIVQHPKGNFVIDSGVSDETEKHVDDHFPFFAKLIIKYTKTSSLKNQLIKNGFNPNSINMVLPTHLHYDHAGGIEELGEITILTTKSEHQNAISNHSIEHGFITQQYDSLVTWKDIVFDSGQYSVFEKSCDLYNDGTIIIVELPGHTHGSLGVFVNLKSGKRYFFIGDTVWDIKGLEKPSEKHIFTRFTDEDRKKINESIVKIHYLSKLDTNLIIVPAHDFEVQKKMAQFPNFE